MFRSKAIDTPCAASLCAASLRRMARRPTPAVVSRLPRLMRLRGVSWTELRRRTLLPPAQLARLRSRDANPRLGVAERVAAALGVPVEAVWQLEDDPPCRR